MTPFEEADARLGAMHGYAPMLSVEADRLLAFMGLVYRGMVGIEIEIPPLDAERLAAYTPDA